MYSSLAISFYFKATPLPVEFGADIIKYLKSFTRSAINIFFNDAILAITFLVECQSDEFLKEIEKKIESDLINYDYLNSILAFVFKLYKYGTQETEQQIRKNIQISILQQLSLNENQQITIVSQTIINLLQGNINQEEKQLYMNQEEKLDVIKKECDEKNEQEKMIMIKSGTLKEICKIIHESLEGEINVLKIQITVSGCNAVSSLLKDNESAFPFATEQGGIVDEIIYLLNKLPLVLIYPAHIFPIRQLINFCSLKQQKILSEKGLLIPLKKILNSRNEEVLIQISYIFQKLICAIGLLEEDGKPNPLFNEMEKDGTLAKLIEIFQNENYINKRINSQTACIIGCLYKGICIPPPYQSSIVNYLKKISQFIDEYLSYASIIALSCLSEHQGNHTYIQDQAYLQKLNDKLNNNLQQKYYDDFIHLFTNIFKSGTNDTKQQIINIININYIEQLTHHLNKSISNQAREFIIQINLDSIEQDEKEKWIQNEIILKEIILQCEDKSSEEKMKIIEQGGLKEICKIIHSSLEGEMNWNKQYLTRIGCEAAYALLEENKESFLFAIEIGGIIDEVISLLNKLSIENINYQHLLPLFRITNFSNFEQRKILVEKGILKGLSKTFSSENDLVVSFSVFMASRILNGIGQLKGEGKQNPLFQELESDGTLTKLVEIFLTDKFDDIFVKVYSACSIGRIFKATQLPVEFGFQVIKYLKDISIGSNEGFSIQSLITLTCLAECECTKTHSLILVEEFLHKMSYILIEEKENLYKPFLELVLKLFKYGIDETKLNLKKKLNIDQINKLKSNENQQISNNAVELLKLFDEFIKNDQGSINEKCLEKT